MLIMSKSKKEKFRKKLVESGNTDLLKEFNAIWPPKKPTQPTPEGK